MRARNWLCTALFVTAPLAITAVSGTPQDSEDAPPQAQRPYPMYTPRTAYGEGDLTWWKGRNVAGAAIGVLQFPANIPMMPGNVGNATTFDFPVIYRQVNDIDIWALVEGRSSKEDMAKIIAGAKALEIQGVRAIVANCGYWANYQKEIGDAVSIPFMSSSLCQVPWMLNILKPSQKLMVVTLNVELLENAPALEAVGVHDRSRLVIVSGDKSDEYKRVAAEAGALNPQKFEREIVQVCKDALKANPDVGAILLECTELTSFSWAVQEATGLPVLDSITPIKWIHSIVVQRPYYGHL
jgi:Asp/Glu/hydantoin racemase